MRKKNIVFHWDQDYPGSLTVLYDNVCTGRYETSLPKKPGCSFTGKAVASDDGQMVYVTGTEKSAEKDGVEVNCVFLYTLNETEDLPSWECIKTFLSDQEDWTDEVHYGACLDCTSDGKIVAIGCPSHSETPGWIEFYLLKEDGSWTNLQMSGVGRGQSFGASFEIKDDFLHIGNSTNTAPRLIPL